MNEKQATLKPRELKALQDQAAKYPGCRTCQRLMEDGQYFSPRHEASDACGSGKRSHCTCDFCF